MIWQYVSVITVTATEAARDFARVLDAVEHGEVVVITRDGVPTCRISPEHRTSADLLKAALRDHPADAGFADDVAAARMALGLPLGRRKNSRQYAAAISLPPFPVGISGSLRS